MTEINLEHLIKALASIRFKRGTVHQTVIMNIAEPRVKDADFEYTAVKNPLVLCSLLRSHYHLGRHSHK